jgi:hypothetical protein
MELHIPNGIATADRDRKEHDARVSIVLMCLDFIAPGRLRQ